MASDAALYRSPALQAERARLVFNAALQTELRAVARHREVSSVPLSTGPTISTSGAVRPSKPVLPQGAGKSTEPGGWDVDRKMKSLAELQTQLRRPFFFYLDFGTTVAASGSGGGSGGLSKDIKLQFSFSKILPLQAGQAALLDLWCAGSAEWAPLMRSNELLRAGTISWTCATSCPCVTAAARSTCSARRTFAAASSSSTGTRSTDSRSAWTTKVPVIPDPHSLSMVLIYPRTAQLRNATTSCWSGRCATAPARCARPGSSRTSTDFSSCTSSRPCFSASQ